MGTHIKYFKYLLESNIQHYENLFLYHAATFSLKVQSLMKESMKKQSLPTFPIIKQIQSSWKGRVDILKALMENATILEDNKSYIFFNVSNVIKQLECPPLIKGSTLISTYEVENEFSKLKDKWDWEFDDLSYLSEDNMHAWTIDYANLNNNIYIFIFEFQEGLIQGEKDIFKMNIKEEIIVPPLQDFIFAWLKKQLVEVTKTTYPWYLQG